MEPSLTMVVPGTDGSSASLTRCTRLRRCRCTTAGHVLAVTATKAAHVIPCVVTTLHNPGVQSSMTAAAVRDSSPRTHDKQCERGLGMNGVRHLLIGCQVCFPAGRGRSEAVLVPQLVLLLQYAVERQLDGLPAALVRLVLLHMRGQRHVRTLFLSPSFLLVHLPRCSAAHDVPGSCWLTSYKKFRASCTSSNEASGGMPSRLAECT